MWVIIHVHLRHVTRMVRCGAAAFTLLMANTHECYCFAAYLAYTAEQFVKSFTVVLSFTNYIILVVGHIQLKWEILRRRQEEEDETRVVRFSFSYCCVKRGAWPGAQRRTGNLLPRARAVQVVLAPVYVLYCLLQQSSYVNRRPPHASSASSYILSRVLTPFSRLAKPKNKYQHR